MGNFDEIGGGARCGGGGDSGKKSGNSVGICMALHWNSWEFLTVWHSSAILGLSGKSALWGSLGP